jgi:Activator of Hsp90 ATPase homolog 1-like protein
LPQVTSLQGEIMTVTAQTIADLTLNITQEMRVKAPLDATFASLLEEMGPHNVTPDGKPLTMKIEAWPGGRWYRDLGDNNGHFWGHVQAIKRPTLLEIVGPLFASYPFASNLQYRLSESKGGTLITLRHSALGFLPEENKKKVSADWAALLERVRKVAEDSSGGAARERAH